MATLHFIGSKAFSNSVHDRRFKIANTRRAIRPPYNKGRFLVHSSHQDNATKEGPAFLRRFKKTRFFSRST